MTMDVNINVPIKVSGLKKLVDCVASGIGSIAGPMLAPWREGREARAKQIAAKGEAEALRILAEGESSALQTIANARADAQRKLVSSDISIQGQLTIAEMVEQRIQFQEEKRLGNIGSVVRLAAEELEGKEVPDDEPDHDLMARFFNDVQDVSSEELQKLWAKLLSGEVERPGTASIRSLSILRNLDQNTASLFSKLCSVSLATGTTDGNQYSDVRVLSLNGNASQNALKKYGFGFDTLNVLNEHGLIISDYDSWCDYQACGALSIPEAKQQIILCNPFYFQGLYWLLRPKVSPVGKTLKLTGVALTQAGRELSRIVNLKPIDEYAQDLRKFFENKGLRMTETDIWAPKILPVSTQPQK